MSRRNNNQILVPGAKDALNELKKQVMNNEGYQGDANQVKYEIAKEKQIPLKKGYNGTLTSKEAGLIGGKIGGSMVKEMIRMAQKSLEKK